MMPQSPFFYLIRIYFPPEEWDRADCISTRECSPDRPGYPASCIGDEGLIDCGHGPQQARSWGIFQILDACWNPAMNPNSPFTPEQWARVLDPNVNTWMASVIWSRSGWRAWTTCESCQACDVVGGPIPYPRGPIDIKPVDWWTFPGGLSGPLALAIAGIGFLVASAITLDRAQRGGP